VTTTSQLSTEPPSPTFLKENKETDEPFSLKLYEYCLMLWDGLGFFGFDDTKLERLRGAPVTFFSKFSSIKWTIFTIIAWVVIITVIFTELGSLGKVKT
jgi:hypothetical protein